MDSRDKMTNDLTEQVSKQQVIINQKDEQIRKLENISAELQRKQAGVNAIQETLESEQALTQVFSKQIESLKARVNALTDLNNELTQMNLKLQRPQVQATAEPLKIEL
jgi:chromosome segregation ATPase